MTLYRSLLTASAIAMAMSLAACGGGSGGGGAGLVTTPAPAPSPAPGSPPIITPSPATGAALLAPMQTDSPESPIATAGGPSFPNPGAGNTVFPLMITAVAPDFGGDEKTTDAGGTLSFGADGFALTLNNANLNVVNATHQFQLPPDGHPVVQVSGASDNLDYTRYGYWTLPAGNPYYDVGAGSFLGGYVTAASEIPTTGSANYAGGVVGLYKAGSFTSGFGIDALEIIGDVHLSVDFGSASLLGSMTNLQFTDSEFIEIPLNDIGFSATLDAARNLFTGTTSVTSIPAGPHSEYAFSASASGLIAGRFFGPGAREAGAVWTLSDGQRSIIGSLGVARTGQ